MADVTDKQLAELEQLLSEVSPRPWRVEHSDTDDIEVVAVLHPHGTVCMEAEDEAGAWEDDTRDTIVWDLTLAAKARNLLPAILAELKRHRGADPAVIVHRKK
jgi:hypothetical protein